MMNKTTVKIVPDHSEQKVSSQSTWQHIRMYSMTATNAPRNLKQNTISQTTYQYTQMNNLAVKAVVKFSRHKANSQST